MRLRNLLTLALLLLTLSRASAQDSYRYEIGGAAGMSGYLGDAGASLFGNTGAAAEGVFRYKPSPRFAFKSYLQLASMHGDSSKSDNYLPGGEKYKFSTTVFEVGETAEFNFFNYGIGQTYQQLKPLVPYISAGLGIAAWSTDGAATAALTLPMGCGLRYKPAERWNLGVEFMMKKFFSDRLDSSRLNDPYGIKSSLMKNTDWQSTLTLSVTYEFGQRCEACNYKE